MPELAVIVPTLNERANVAPLARQLDEALQGIDYEVVFVDDDSADGTARAARQLAQADKRVRVVQRIGRRGLSSAAVEGMLATSAPYMAVIDGDLQHDAAILPKLLDAVRRGGAEMAVGTRNAEPGGMGTFAAHRVALSSLGRMLSRAVCRTELSDPMSGFFLIRRALFDEVAHRLSLTGFKILVDIVASAARPIAVAEVAYTFGERRHGQSKLDTLVAVEYLLLLLHQATRGWVPVHYLMYGLVGSTGVAVNAALVAGLRAEGLAFGAAQGIAGAVVIGLNFLLNNRLTFRSNRLRRGQQLTGLATYAAACAVGLAMNVNLAAVLVRGGMSEVMAGASGIAVASVWNYWVTSLAVWRVGRAVRASQVAESAAAEFPVSSEADSQSLEALRAALEPAPVNNHQNVQSR